VDQRNFSFTAFTEWRDAVDRLYTIINYSVAEQGENVSFTRADGTEIHARRFRVQVTEEEQGNGKQQRGESSRVVISEGGRWRVLLGYPELTPLTNAFREKFAQKLRQQFADEWQARWEEHCPELGVLSTKGLIKAAQREIYTYRRYKRPFALAALSITVPQQLTARAESDLLQMTAHAIRSHVRQTDVVAYAGDSIFLVLFAEMKRRYVLPVTDALAAKTAAHIAAHSGYQPQFHAASSPYRGGALEQEIELLLKKFHFTGKVEAKKADNI
jgi:GGDEF domain-containing protein